MGGLYTLAESAVTASKLNTGAEVATVAANEATDSTSYTSLTTTTDKVTVTIGSNGMALIILSSEMFFAGGSGNMYVSYKASGANTTAANDNFAIISNVLVQDSYARLVTGLTPGSTTFAMQYRVSSGTADFLNRSITVIPL